MNQKQMPMISTNEMKSAFCELKHQYPKYLIYMYTMLSEYWAPGAV